MHRSSPLGLRILRFCETDLRSPRWNFAFEGIRDHRTPRNKDDTQVERVAVCRFLLSGFRTTKAKLNSLGRPRSGWPRSGWPISGRPCSGRPLSGRPISGRPRSGWPISGRPRSGRPRSGWPISGRPCSGRPRSGWPELLPHIRSTILRDFAVRELFLPFSIVPSPFLCSGGFSAARSASRC